MRNIAIQEAGMAEKLLKYQEGGPDWLRQMKQMES
jgi:hypothetical protein